MQKGLHPAALQSVTLPRWHTGMEEEKQGLIPSAMAVCLFWAGQFPRCGAGKVLEVSPSGFVTRTFLQLLFLVASCPSLLHACPDPPHSSALTHLTMPGAVGS